MGNRRFYRSLFLCLAALAVLVWAAVAEFGVSRQEVADLLVAVLWFSLGIIALALLCALLWIGLRKLLQR